LLIYSAWGCITDIGLILDLKCTLLVSIMARNKDARGENI
jgi:hypothetical protein